MNFLQSFSIQTTKRGFFPFNIPAVMFAQHINLDHKLTIFVGDNGTGKSTLLESLALKLNLPLIGGMIGSHAGFEAAKLLQPFVQIQWNRETMAGFFFRAEDFSDFVNAVQREKEKIYNDLSYLHGQVDDAIIQQMSDSMNFSLRNMRKDYGEDMQAFSHGEAYLKILQTRIKDKGIFLLDEPEAALSPLKQLSLISFIMEVMNRNNAQFIISTHSPILMGIPNANLYQIIDTGMEQVKYRETEHYSITKNFLDNPDYYLRYL